MNVDLRQRTEDGAEEAGPAPAAADAPLSRPRDQHPISRQDIDPNALKVLYRLHRSGYKAYLVGGSVRDLMLSGKPKDFDVGTDAKPAEIRRLFRNARIIGRRFRLAHILFHEGLIEVSTFRCDPDPEDQDRSQGEHLVTSDNTYGTPRQDAFRRDFTINALFYDIGDFSVIDYTGGLEDLERRLVRVIGDPDLRFREDPVRMLRACEFAGRLSFSIEGRTQEGIHRQRHEVQKASPARLTEEILQLLRCGHSGAAMQWMLDLGLLEIVLPEAYAAVAVGEGSSEYLRILPAVDRLVREGRELSEITLLSALLLPAVLRRRDDIEALAGHPMGRQAIRELTADVIQPFFDRFVLSKLKAQQVVQSIAGFQWLCEPRWKPGVRAQLVRRAFFPTALMLFELMVTATGEGKEPLEQWTAAAKKAGAGKARPQRRPRRRRTRARVAPVRTDRK